MPLGRRRSKTVAKDNGAANEPDVAKSNTEAFTVGKNNNFLTSGKFAPGNSIARAGGRTQGFAGLAKAIQVKTRGGQILMEFAFDVFQGRVFPTDAQLKMHTWLAERGFGKAVQSVELQAVVSKEDGATKAQMPVDRLSLEDKDRLYELMRKMEVKEDRPIARMVAEATVRTVIEGVLETDDEEGEDGEEE